MPENNPFFKSNKSSPKSGGILDIDKIVAEEKTHAHKGAVPIPNNNQVKQNDIPVSEPSLDMSDNRPTIDTLPEFNNEPKEELVNNPVSSENSVKDDELNTSDEKEVDNDIDKDDQQISAWRPPTRRIPHMDRISNNNEELADTVDSPEIDNELEPTDDIILNKPKNTPNRRNLMLIVGGILLVIALIIFIPMLINNGILYKTNDTGTTGIPGTSSDSTSVTAGLDQEVSIKKVDDGLESDDPDKWEITFTADTTDIKLSVDCTSKPGGGTSPNLSCISSQSNEVIDGTFVKPFTAGEGWTYDGEDYGYCYNFSDKVSSRTVQSELYGSSAIQLFYMADDFKICTKKAGNPETIPKDTPCDTQEAYCPAVRLRSIS